jgi:2-dehydro-3-deoxygluconokinase
MAPLAIRETAATRWDIVALGEVMLRLDPGEGRIATTRSFRAWEGGGEYNVARGLARCFGLRAAIVTALADNAVGRLIEDLVRQGGVDLSLVRWVAYDGIGRTVRNGLNFTERGFGIRAPLGVSDRANSAASQLAPTQVDWEVIFGTHGARWFHTGGIFAALSGSTAEVAREAMSAARRHGTVTSYDLNFRPSLWAASGGRDRAREVNRELVSLADVLVGNEEDFDVALGFDEPGATTDLTAFDPRGYERLVEQVARAFPNLELIAVTLRTANSATRNDWGALLWADGRIYQAPLRHDLEILDRVGGGDSFASGLIYGQLRGLDPQASVDYGAAHGALAMTTPGDTSMATLAEVEAAVLGAAARISR